MTHAELITETLRLAGEDPTAPVFHSAANATIALNEAQALHAMLTLCLETVTSVAVITRWFTPITTMPAYIAPLTIHRDWLQMKPISLEELAALSNTWRTTTGAPARYMQAGWQYLGLWPAPDTYYSISVRYAKSPAALSLDADVPEIPPEYHSSLIEYAVPRLRILEGGDEFTAETRRFADFFGAAKQHAKFIRARSVQLNYDTSPTEKWFGLAEAKAWSTLRQK